MSEEFNKKLMFDNIYFLLDRSGKKIGELESEAGVSTGYISRTSKDDNTKPGIDFVVNVAEALGVSVDTLINISMGGLTSTELYLVSFFEKLKKDTTMNKLDWNRESADILNRMEYHSDGYVDHLMFSVETFFEKGESEYPNEVTRAVMMSHAYDANTYIAGDCFNLNMKNGSKLYIMNISKASYNLKDSDAFTKEVWIYEPKIGKQFLTSNQMKSELSVLVDDLYETVLEFSKHPKVKREIQYVIDSYINEDDLDDDIPF